MSPAVSGCEPAIERTGTLALVEYDLPDRRLNGKSDGKHS